MSAGTLWWPDPAISGDINPAPPCCGRQPLWLEGCRQTQSQLFPALASGATADPATAHNEREDWALHLPAAGEDVARMPLNSDQRLHLIAWARMGTSNRSSPARLSRRSRRSTTGLKSDQFIESFPPGCRTCDTGRAAPSSGKPNGGHARSANAVQYNAEMSKYSVHIADWPDYCFTIGSRRTLCSSTWRFVIPLKPHIAGCGRRRSQV